MRHFNNMMLKTLSGLFIVLLVFTMINCNNDSKRTSEEEQNTTQNNKPSREEPKIVYDNKGNIIERYSKTYHKREGYLKSSEKYFYVYDDKNNVIEETKESYTAEEELKFKNVNIYTYDDKNQKIEQNFYSYDKNDSLQRHARTTIEYNELGYSVLEKTYFEDGSVKGVIIRDPDEKGALRSEEYIHYNLDGTKKDHKKYYYTEYGLGKTEDLMEKK